MEQGRRQSCLSEGSCSRTALLTRLWLCTAWGRIQGRKAVLRNQVIYYRSHCRARYLLHCPATCICTRQSDLSLVISGGRSSIAEAADARILPILTLLRHDDFSGQASAHTVMQRTSRLCKPKMHHKPLGIRQPRLLHAMIRLQAHELTPVGVASAARGVLEPGRPCVLIWTPDGSMEPSSLAALTNGSAS